MVVSDLVLNEFHTTMLINYMDITHLMTPSQQIQEEHKREIQGEK